MIERRIDIQSPIKHNKRITSTIFEYFAIFTGFFLKRKYSPAIIIVIIAEKGRQLRVIFLDGVLKLDPKRKQRI